MRNLKRALSMALAAVMVLGLMVVGASAASYNDFTDKDEIVHKDAVAMVTELGVLAGLPDGSFGGTQNIDRASFARLVCVVLNGGKEPVLGNLTTTFTDTQGNWAEKYIAFCVDRGIIAGRGNNTFGPSDNVTGSEAAKMLLVALGYNTAYEGIGGSTWEITTNSLANMAGLYDGLETINPSEPLTRDNAAQMIYNVLNANTVDYTFSFNANGTTTAVQNKNKTTMLEDKFGVIIVEGTVVANEFADLRGTGSDDEGETVIRIPNNADQTTFSAGDKTFKVSTGEDVLGRTVTLYAKPSTTASSNSSKATVIGAPIVSSENVVVTDLSKDTVAEVAKDNDLTTNGNTVTCYNYALSTANGVTAISVGQGVEKTLVDNNNDGVIDYTFINRFDLGKVTKYSTSGDGAIVVKTDKSSDEYEKADVVGFDDVAKDDYVLTAVIGGKLYVEKPETVVGTLELYKTSSGLTTSLTVDGTEYKVSNVAKVHSDLTNADTYGATQLNTEATFYLDRNGYIIAAGDVEEAAYSYAYVIATDPGASNGIDTDRVKVALADGTTGVYEFTKNTGANGVQTIGAVTVGDVYRYSITSDNKIKLTDDVNPTAAVSTAKFEKGKAAVNLGTNGITYATNNTLFFYTDGQYEDVDVYTGFTNAPSTELTIGVGKTMEVWKTNSNRVVAVTVVGGTTSVSSNDHLYIYSVGGKNNDYTIANAVIGGQTDVVESAKFSTDGLTPVAGNLYRYTMNSDGEYVLTAVDKTSASTYFASGVVTEKFDGSFVVSGGVNGAEYGLTSNTIVVDDVDDPTTPSVETKGGFSKGDYVNVIFDRNTNDALMVVIVANDNSIYTVESGIALTTGDVTVDGEQVTVTNNKFNAYAGSDVVITKAGITNSAEYYVGNGNYVTAETSGNTVKFTMPNYSFKFDEAFSVTYNAGANADASYSVPATAWYVKNDTPTVAPAAVAATGYQFIGWSDGSNLYAAGDSVVALTGDVTLTAVYLSNTVTATDDASASGLGSSDAGFQFTTSVDVNTSVTAVSATGTGTVCGAIQNATGTVSGSTTLTADITAGTGYNTSLATAALANGDAITFTLTVTYQDAGTATFAVTYTYAD